MRNYKRKTDYKPLTEDQLNEARRLIAEGFSYRKASKHIGFNETTLRTRLKKGACEKLGRFRRTFTADQERELVNHCIALDQRFFGLTLKSLRFLLFKYAEDNSISHQFSGESKLAGRDFTRDFMKRNRLSLRVPRKTSIARAMGFNRVQLAQYFENLGSVLRTYEFTSNQIFNMDETGVQTVPNKLPLHVAPTGKREIAKTVAAEQGQTVTAVCAINAVGNYVPPYFIYARKRENRQLLRGGPIGCDMAVTDKGYMNTSTFIKWLLHFEKYAVPSKENQILLILDNHISHKSLEAITFAKHHYIHLLTLPPHSSHKTQPLDRCFFGPLKSYYDAAVDSWGVSNPGQTFNVYSVAATFKVAFEKAATIATAVQGFKVTGIHPFDPNIFVAADFLPSEVTDQQLPELEDVDQRIICLNHEDADNDDEVAVLKERSPDPEILTSILSATIKPQHGNPNIVTPPKQDTLPQHIIPLPKIQKTRKRTGKGWKSVLLTSTPNKEQVENEYKIKEKLTAEKEKRAKERKERAEAKKRKLDFSVNKSKVKRKMNRVTNGKNTKNSVDSSETDEDFSVHDSSSDFDDFFNEGKSDQEEEIGISQVLRELPGSSQQLMTLQKNKNSPLLLPNEYAVVKVQGKTKNSFRHYVAKIIFVHNDGGYEVVFYKKLPGAYKFTETNEESFIDVNDIVVKLSQPTGINSARFHNAISFSEDLQHLNIY